MRATVNSPELSELKRKRKRLYKHMIAFSTRLDEAIKTHRKLQDEIFKDPYKDWREPCK
jgi:hypothetical protein